MCVCVCVCVCVRVYVCVCVCVCVREGRAVILCGFGDIHRLDIYKYIMVVVDKDTIICSSYY